MRLPETDLWRLKHVLLAIADVEECLRRGTRGDRIVQAALERFVANIGEMCRGVSDALKVAYPHIPWADIVAMRNFLVHEYHKVKTETIWDVAEHKIPALKDWVKAIIEAHEKH